MNNFAVSYRQGFWPFFVVYLVSIALSVFFQLTDIAPLLGIILTILSLILSVIHFVGLLAVFIDTHRRLTINSAHLKQILEILERSDAIKKSFEDVANSDSSNQGESVSQEEGKT